MATPTETLYQQVIKGIPDAWFDLKKHPHKRTSDINNENILSFAQNAEENIKRITKLLTHKKYLFQQMRPVELSQKGKKRQVLISAVEDRIVSKAILNVISPLFKEFNSQCDFSRDVPRPEGVKFKGVPLAALYVQDYIREGYHWVLEADIKKFFDNVPKDKILALVQPVIPDPDLMGLIENIVQFQIANVTEEEARPQKGIAQGSSISPLLASVYLFSFDEHIKKHDHVRLVRYVDDFIILCKDEGTARSMYVTSRDILKDMGLEVHELNIPDEKGRIKTRAVYTKQGSFDFLGLSFNYLDIDIAEGKKKDYIAGIEEILHSRPYQFYRKTQKIERKSIGFIRQYYQKHYTRAIQSLQSLLNEAQARVEEDYINDHKGVFGRDFYSKLNQRQREKLLAIFGLDINKLLK